MNLLTPWQSQHHIDPTAYEANRVASMATILSGSTTCRPEPSSRARLWRLAPGCRRILFTEAARPASARVLPEPARRLLLAVENRRASPSRRAAHRPAHRFRAKKRTSLHSDCFWARRGGGIVGARLKFVRRMRQSDSANSHFGEDAR